MIKKTFNTYSYKIGEILESGEINIEEKVCEKITASEKKSLMEKGKFIISETMEKETWEISNEKFKKYGNKVVENEGEE